MENHRWVNYTSGGEETVHQLCPQQLGGCGPPNLTFELWQHCISVIESTGTAIPCVQCHFSIYFEDSEWMIKVLSPSPLAVLNKNLAIANRSRVSCAHNTSMASRLEIQFAEIGLKYTSKSKLGVTEGQHRRWNTATISQVVTLNIAGRILRVFDHQATRAIN